MVSILDLIDALGCALASLLAPRAPHIIKAWYRRGHGEPSNGIVAIIVTGCTNTGARIRLYCGSGAGTQTVAKSSRCHPRAINACIAFLGHTDLHLQFPCMDSIRSARRQPVKSTRDTMRTNKTNRQLI